MGGETWPNATYDRAVQRGRLPVRVRPPKLWLHGPPEQYRMRKLELSTSRVRLGILSRGGGDLVLQLARQGGHIPPVPEAL
jgi:hypothetical protein